ncbi:MAG: hypothetical protein ACK4WD_03435 [Flavobacteriales bacterium]|jgi:hypothetical protein
MNGQERNCRLVSDTGFVITYEYTKRNGKVKMLSANRGEVFSYTKAGNPEVIIYEMDTLFSDNVYDATQMRAFLAGQNDARSNFKARHIAAIGFVSCAVIGFVGQDGYFTAVGPPIIYTLTQFIGKVKIREHTMTNVNYKYNDIYADGYEPPARTKKLITSLWSGFLGSAVGVSLYFVTR